MDAGSKREELDLTPDEMSRFSEAIKDEKFRDMLREYAEEISNPENKKKYEEEITLMEQERGMDVKFVHPKPERVLKTSLDGKQKCFINLCSNELIGEPQCRAERGANGRVGQQWSLPYSLTPGRPDLDSKGNKYVIYDVVFHPDTFYIAGKNDRFMKLIESTAIQGVQDQFKVKLDEKNVKVLKMKYKGVPSATVIRKRVPGGNPCVEKNEEPNDPLSFPYPYDCSQNQLDNPNPKPKKCLQDRSNEADLRNITKPTEPHYTVKYRSYIDLQDYRCSRDSAPDPRPKEIVITVDLPLLNSAEKADLNVTEKCIVLESLKPSYRLELPLAYPVDENKGGAKFNKFKKQLTITLPVLPAKNQLTTEANSQQLVSEVVSGENSDDGDGKITPLGDIEGQCVSEVVSGENSDGDGGKITPLGDIEGQCVSEVVSGENSDGDGGKITQLGDIEGQCVSEVFSGENSNDDDGKITALGDIEGQCVREVVSGENSDGDGGKITQLGDIENQCVSEVVSGENSDEDNGKITQSGDIEGQLPVFELVEQPECRPLDCSAVASPSPANTTGFELTERAIEEADSCPSSSESGCRTDTSKLGDMVCTETVPRAEQAEAGSDCEENFNEEEEADISHPSPDSTQDEKSEATSDIPSNLGSGVQTGTHSCGPVDKGPCCEFGPEPCTAPRSASTPEQRSQCSLPQGDAVKDQGGIVLSKIEDSQPGPSRGLSPAEKGGGCKETENFCGSMGEAEEERAELDEDDVPFENQPCPAVLKEISGDDVRPAVVSDHTTSDAFTFQNSLLYELD